MPTPQEFAELLTGFISTQHSEFHTAKRALCDLLPAQEPVLTAIREAVQLVEKEYNTSADSLMIAIAEKAMQPTDQGAGTDWRHTQSALMTYACAIGLLQVLQAHLVRSPDAIQLLVEQNQSQTLSAALSNYPCQHIPTANLLLPLIDQNTDIHCRAAAEAIGAVLRDDEPVLLNITSKLSSRSDSVKVCTLRIIELIGPPVVQADPNIINILSSRILSIVHNPVSEDYSSHHHNQVIFMTALSLASVGRFHEPTVDIFLELSRSSEMWLVGVSIEALGVCRISPHKTIHRLIELLDTYAESNPYDYTPFSRIADSLAKYGVAAAHAIPELKNAATKYDDYDKDDPEDPLVNAIQALEGGDNLRNW